MPPEMTMPSDRVDASNIAAIARTCVARDLTRARAVRIMRRAIEECWDVPRQSRQTHRSYRRDALWSIGAVKLRGADTTGLLIQEHVIPASYLADRILDRCQGKAGVTATLEALYESPLAIVTKEEDTNFLSKRKGDLGFAVKQEMPPGWEWGDNPWMRYFVCGFPGFQNRDATGADAGFLPFDPPDPAEDDLVI